MYLENSHLVIACYKITTEHIFLVSSCEAEVLEFISYLILKQPFGAVGKKGLNTFGLCTTQSLDQNTWSK